MKLYKKKKASVYIYIYYLQLFDLYFSLYYAYTCFAVIDMT